MTHTARDGWKLVPVECSREMYEASNLILDNVGWMQARKAYRAMLSAAPSPPSEVAREEIARAIYMRRYGETKTFDQLLLNCTSHGSPGYESMRNIMADADAVLSLFHQRGEKG